MDAVRLLGSLLGNNATGGNLLGSLLGGAGGGRGSGGGGGLGALAGMLGGGGAGGGQGGGLGALAGMLGGGGAGGGRGGGGLGDMLGSLAGAGAMPGGGAPARAEQHHQDEAKLLIRAMCNAAKADGKIDQAEVNNIMGRLGEIDEAEARFLKRELEAPLDLDGFVRDVPVDMAEQVYAFSLMGMKLDTKQEAQYLGAVGKGLGMRPEQCNQIHAKLGVPEIFT